MSEKPGFRFFQLVARNLANHPYRNIAMILTFAIIAATLFSAQYLMGGAQQSLDTGISRMGADLLVVPSEYSAAGQTVLLRGEPTSFFFKNSGFEQISRIPGVAKASPQIYVATLYGAKCCSAPVQIIAIDPEHDFTISSWLKENPGTTLGKDDVIVGAKIDGAIGTDLVFFGHTYKISGRLATTGMGVDYSVFTRIEDAYVMADESGQKAIQKLTIPKGMVSAVLVQVNREKAPSAVATEIQAAVPGTKIITAHGLLNTVAGQLGGITRLLYGATLAVTVVSIPLLGFISAMVANERRREISILRALGATRNFVMRMVLAESFTLAIVGGIIGIGAASVILVAFQDYIALNLKIPFITPSPLTLLMYGGGALSLAAIIGGIASFYPALLVTRADPYETIRKGEK